MAVMASLCTRRRFNFQTTKCGSVQMTKSSMIPNAAMEIVKGLMGKQKALFSNGMLQLYFRGRQWSRLRVMKAANHSTLRVMQPYAGHETR